MFPKLILFINTLFGRYAAEQLPNGFLYRSTVKRYDPSILNIYT